MLKNTHLYGLCDPDGVWRDDAGRQIDQIELPAELPPSAAKAAPKRSPPPADVPAGAKSL